VLICWDQWYPEGARLAALGGASVIFYPTAIGWGAAEQAHVKPVQREAWKTMHRAHAIANGVFVAAPNRTGVEDGITFWGTSLVCGPFGEILAEASTGGEEILIAECDPARIEEVRRGWPFLRDRRIDAYGPILNRWNG
jgi:N-carbamoylputrescine amidase